MASLNKAVREAVAFHEAAHAVVATALGIKVKSTPTVPVANQTSQFRHRSPLSGMEIAVGGPAPAREDAENAIKICLAGAIAYRKRRPQSWREAYGLGDFETAFDVARRASGSAEAAAGILEGLLLQAMVLVDARWTEIEAVAREMLEHGSLTGAEIDKVLHSPDGLPPPTAADRARDRRAAARGKPAKIRRRRR